jgi:hypothetical protein
MSWKSRTFFRGMARVVLVAVSLAAVAPPPSQAATCGSMGERWFEADQEGACNTSCAEACIKKWDCQGEPCAPSFCWKCAVDSPPPPPPPPPPDDDPGADGRRCDTMGPGWFFSNQGDLCNQSCSEACIVKWDCDGEACRPHHCWKCTPTANPGEPPPPGGGGGIKLSNALADISLHADDATVYVRASVKAFDPAANVRVELRLERADGTLIDAASNQGVEAVDATTSMPVDELPDDGGGEVQAMAIPGWVVLVVVVAIGAYDYVQHRRTLSRRERKQIGCWKFDRWANGSCHYKDPDPVCGGHLCVTKVEWGWQVPIPELCPPFVVATTLSTLVQHLGIITNSPGNCRMGEPAPLGVTSCPASFEGCVGKAN